MTKSLRDHEPTMEYLTAAHPFKGLGEPEDLAKVAVFLASDDASWVSGVPLPVDGQYIQRNLTVMWTSVLTILRWLRSSMRVTCGLDFPVYPGQQDELTCWAE